MSSRHFYHIVLFMVECNSFVLWSVLYTFSLKVLCCSSLLGDSLLFVYWTRVTDDVKWLNSLKDPTLGPSILGPLRILWGTQLLYFDFDSRVQLVFSISNTLSPDLSILMSLSILIYTFKGQCSDLIKDKDPRFDLLDY